MNTIQSAVRGVFSLGLVLIALHPADSRAAATSQPFLASFVGQSKLASSGTNSYTIGDKGTGYATGEGQGTLVADETEHLVDANSPCGYAVKGTATLSDTQGDSLRLQFTAHTCGFGSDTDATILKAGTFTIVGGTGPFAHAAGGGAMYKLGLFHAPTTVFQFQGTNRYHCSRPHVLHAVGNMLSDPGPADCRFGPHRGAGTMTVNAHQVSRREW